MSSPQPDGDSLPDVFPRSVVLAVLGLALLAGVVAVSVAAAGPSPADAPDGPVTETNASDDEEMLLTVWRGEQGLRDRLSNRSTLRAAMESDALVRSSTVTETETLVVALRGPGLDERVASADGPNETVRFFEATQGENSGIRLEETHPSTMRAPYAVRLNSTAATTVVADSENDTYYVITDPLEFEIGTYGYGAYECGHCSTADLFRGEQFRLNVTLDGRTRLFPGDEDGEPRTAVRFLDADPTFVYGETRSAAAVEVVRTTDARVRASTWLRPGTNVTIRVTNRSDGGRDAVTRTTVSESGDHQSYEPAPGRSFISAPLDTSQFDPNATFDLEVVVDDRVIASADGEVGLTANDAAGTTIDAPTVTPHELTGTDTATAGTAPASTADDRTPTRAETARESDASPTSSGSGPGFGPLVALAILAGTALVGGRLRN